MVRSLGIPILLSVLLFCAVQCTPNDSIKRFDSQRAVYEFLDKMANADFEPDSMMVDETETVERSDESDSNESIETLAKNNSSRPTASSQETLFHHLFGGMDKELANVFNLVTKTAMEKQWWRGDNVCVDREESIENSNDTETAQLGQLFSFGAAQFSSCRHSPSKYVCTTTTHKRGESKTVVVTYQCCHGYRRIDSKGQCTKFDLKSLPDVMSDVGGSEFMRMVKDIGMDQTLNEKNVTVFVPDDEAVRAYENEFLATNNVRMRRRIEADEDYKNDLSPNDMILSHVIPGLVDTDEISNEELLYSENHNSSIRMNIYPGEKDAIITANCAEIKSKNNPSNNGLVHLVSKVMKPVDKNLMQLIQQEPTLSMFAKLVENANLSKALSEHPHITLFAPNNDAFEKMEPGLRNKYLSGQACVKSVLKHHIVPHTICSAAIPNRKRSTININGEWLSLERHETGKLIVDEKAHTETADLMATNGVIHIVNKVIQPKSAQPTSQVLIQSNHTSWLDLVKRANLMDMLDQTSNLTVFVPSEAALNDPETQEKLSKMEAEELRDVIMYHTAQPKICSCEMIEDMKINSTLEGRSLQLDVFNSLHLFGGAQQRATVQCARITRTDEKGCETVAHEIDRLLIPPTQTTVEYIKSNPNLTVLSSILEGTKILSELSDDTNEGFTFLAPSDEAFKTVGEVELNKLKEDKELADGFIRKHVLEDHICCSSVGPVVWPFINEISNLAGGAVDARSDRNGKVHFSSATATSCDNIAKDGVIHFINKPLLPRSLQDSGTIKMTDPNTGTQILLFGV